MTLSITHFNLVTSGVECEVHDNQGHPGRIFITETKLLGVTEGESFLNVTKAPRAITFFFLDPDKPTKKVNKLYVGKMSANLELIYVES